MKTTQAYYKDGKFLFNERGWPDRSVMKHIGSGEENYPAALTSAIESSVPFEDQRRIQAEVICYMNDFLKTTAGNLFTTSSIKEGLYTMPEVEVNVFTIQRHPNPEIWERVARIVDSSPEPVKQQTQEGVIDFNAMVASVTYTEINMHGEVFSIVDPEYAVFMLEELQRKLTGNPKQP